MQITALKHFQNTWSKYCTEAYSEPCHTSEMGRFAKIINDFQLLTVFTKSSILND